MPTPTPIVRSKSLRTRIATNHRANVCAIPITTAPRAPLTAPTARAQIKARARLQGSVFVRYEEFFRPLRSNLSL